MAGNSFGQIFRITTFGESHGAALGAIIDGCPPGLSLSEADIQKDLDRRKPGQSKYTTQRREPDRVQILSGVFEGKTTGTPIGLKIDNEDQRSKDYSEIKDVFRPAHADFTYEKKYGIRDYRGGGRSSARETAMRVACGAVARKYLGERLGIQVYGFLSQIGDIQPNYVDSTAINENPFFCADPSAVESIAELIDSLRREGDSIGAEVTVMATGMPIGLGEPVFDKLDSDLASALMSINAVKGVGIGDGFSHIDHSILQIHNSRLLITLKNKLAPTKKIQILNNSLNNPIITRTFARNLMGKYGLRFVTLQYNNRWCRTLLTR